MIPAKRNRWNEQPRNRRRRSPASGFTLVEVLLTTILAATLMLGIWTLLNTYIDLFEEGRSKTDETLLVRALMRQLSDDLHSAIQDPIAGRSVKKNRGSTPVRRFGLFGTPTELRFDVLQITPFEGSLTPSVGPEDESSRAPLRASELRTVYYRFVESGRSAEGDSLTQPGLSRRELDFETPYLAEEDDALLGPASLQTDEMPGIEESLAPSPGELLLVDPRDDSVSLAPEVISLKFRYFDGRAWRSHWNSLQRKSLPVAVEVAMQVCSFDERQELYAVETEAVYDEVRDELEDELETLQRGRLDAALTNRPIHRLVIDLPGAPMHRAPHQVRRTAVTRARPRPARRTSPRRATSKPAPAEIFLPDQWMRNEP